VNLAQKKELNAITKFVDVDAMSKRYLNKCAKCQGDLSDFNYSDSLKHIQKCTGKKQVTIGDWF